MENKNIYEKIQLVKGEFLKRNVKKSGKNKFAGYTYYELSDITPVLIELNNKYGLFTSFSYTRELATLTIINIDKPDEKIEYTSPMEELELKGCNKIQALGGSETYSRRYLYMSAYDIIENDMFDATISEEDDTEECIKLTTEMMKLVDETGTDFDELKAYFKVKSSQEMNKKQLKEAITILKKKVNK